jgi:hypothetical protein
MFDTSDSPTFLVQHQIANYAANCEFGILLDWVVLKVLIASIAVDQVTPVRVALPNPAA